jgi:4-carboxymuconolactone decarboxylase
MMQPSDERLPLPSLESMTEAQRAAANDLIAGPRKGVKGPFIPLLRSPELMSRLQKVGEYLRFHSSLPPLISELATLCVARSWSQQFEWVVHVPLALKAGTSQETIDAIRQGRRPSSMSPAEAAVHDFIAELLNAKGVAQATYDAVIGELGVQGLIDLVGIAGYFTSMCMVLNVAHTPPESGHDVELLPSLPC